MKECILCGNEPVRKDDLGEDCSYLVEGPLRDAFSKWKAASERHLRCCGGLSFDRKHLSFHVLGPNESEVEYGYAFHEKHAQAYYYASDHHSSVEECGKEIPYTAKNFWRDLERQAEIALRDARPYDVATCESCGSTYAVGGTCCSADSMVD